MHYAAGIFVALCIAASLVQAADTPKLSHLAQEILSVRKARVQAGDRKDAIVWGRYVAEGYTATDDGGAIRTKRRSWRISENRIRA